jgi:hypothetical protein
VLAIADADRTSSSLTSPARPPFSRNLGKVRPDLIGIAPEKLLHLSNITDDTDRYTSSEKHSIDFEAVSGESDTYLQTVLQSAFGRNTSLVKPAIEDFTAMQLRSSILQHIVMFRVV